MRLTYEIAQGTRNQQVPEYFEAIQEIIPDFETYKKIWLRIAQRKE